MTRQSTAHRHYENKQGPPARNKWPTSRLLASNYNQQNENIQGPPAHTKWPTSRFCSPIFTRHNKNNSTTQLNTHQSPRLLPCSDIKKLTSLQGCFPCSYAMQIMNKKQRVKGFVLQKEIVRHMLQLTGLQDCFPLHLCEKKKIKEKTKG